MIPCKIFLKKVTFRGGGLSGKQSEGVFNTPGKTCNSKTSGKERLTLSDIRRCAKVTPSFYQDSTRMGTPEFGI